MHYARAMAKRRRALAASNAARAELQAAFDDVLGAYRAHPLPTLAGAAVIGFVLAQLRVGSRLVRVGAGIASGPAWSLLQRYWPKAP